MTVVLNINIKNDDARIGARPEADVKILAIRKP
jgi:hypothetical protein